MNALANFMVLVSLAPASLSGIGKDDFEAPRSRDIFLTMRGAGPVGPATNRR